jgi:hypothetical protein
VGGAEDIGEATEAAAVAQQEGGGAAKGEAGASEIGFARERALAAGGEEAAGGAAGSPSRGVPGTGLKAEK